MKRRKFIVNTAGFAILANFIPIGAAAEGPVVLPKSSGSGSSEATKVITTCATTLATLCRKIQLDMGIIDNCYKKMIAETERALKGKKLTARERANLEALHKKLRREYNAQLEIATGKSAKYIKQTQKNIADSFCKKSDKYLKQARKEATAYRKSKDARFRRARVKAGQKNLKTSSRIIRDALDAFIKRVSKNEKSLKPAMTADGTKKIYTAARQKKIAKATARLRNRTSDLFNANRKIDTLRNMK